jgi:hypothetical protein
VPVVVLVPVPHEAGLPAPARLALVQVPPGALVRALVAQGLQQLNLLYLPLPRVVVESGARLHHPDRQSFSAATARNSPPTGKPTYGRARSTR